MTQDVAAPRRKSQINQFPWCQLVGDTGIGQFPRVCQSSRQRGRGRRGLFGHGNKLRATCKSSSVSQASFGISTLSAGWPSFSPSVCVFLLRLRQESFVFIFTRHWRCACAFSTRERVVLCFWVRGYFFSSSLRRSVCFVLAIAVFKPVRLPQDVFVTFFTSSRD